jgi:regulator of replication initiation timing
MKFPLLKPLLLAAFVALLGLAGAQPAAAQSYGDGFEGPSINPFWTVREQSGSVTLSTAQSHGGSQSARFSSASGNQREMHLIHTFASPTKGSFSVYLYDSAPGQETLYEKLNLYNVVTGDFAAVGTQDFDAYCYTAGTYNYNTGVAQGPNAPCGSYPQTSTTNVQRTPGWHKFEIDVKAAGISFSIDGSQVFNAPGDYSYDTVDLSVSGPFWRPNTTAYYDDFNFTALAPEPDPCEQQVQSLQSQIAALQQQNAALQSQVGDLTAQNGQLQQQVGALAAQNAQLSAQVGQLQAQLGAANQTIQNQQAQLDQTQLAIDALLGGVERDFRTEFNDPQFYVPGGTRFARLQNLLGAILNLNHGRKQGLYTNLGGRR